MTNYKLSKLSLLIAVSVFASTNALAQTTLFTNVNTFDGVNEKLNKNCNVLIENNLIKEVCTNSKTADVVVDGGGKTLMPGIIEAHGHIALPFNLPDLAGAKDPNYIALAAAAGAKVYLDHGWTTVRDAGGPAMGYAKAFDEGLAPGPRVYPSGMFLSQTSGHADVRDLADYHPNQIAELPRWNRDYAHLADGVPEVLRATREELRKGAVHIKVMAGGGIASQFDPLHTAQFTLAEMEAVVDAASDWGTYAMVHAYTDKSIARSVSAGVKVIEHGQLMSEDTAELMADNDVWLSPQIAYLLAGMTPERIEHMKKAFGMITFNKWDKVRQGVAQSIEYARDHDLKIAFGTDLWGPRINEITKEFTVRKQFFSNIEILKQATSINGELLKLTGPLNPYPAGDLGVVKVGAYADIILVDGDPLKDIDVLTNKDNIDFVMKDGKVYKNEM